LKLCGVEAIPWDVLKAGRLEGVTTIVGPAGGFTVPVTLTLF
jgi:hypothetical protein